MSAKLFVGNLSFNITENDLQDAFAAHGTVVEANLMMDRATGRPRGFAFITMSTPEEALDSVRSSLLLVSAVCFSLGSSILLIAGPARRIPLAAATAAVASGQVLLGGEPYRWEPDEMVLWRTPHAQDAGAVAAAREAARFELRGGG